MTWKKKKVKFEDAERESSSDSKTESETESETDELQEKVEALDKKVDSTIKTVVRLVEIIKRLTRYTKENALSHSPQLPQFVTIPVVEPKEEPKEESKKIGELEDLEHLKIPIKDGKHSAVCCCRTCWSNPLIRRSFI